MKHLKRLMRRATFCASLISVATLLDGCSDNVLTNAPALRRSTTSTDVGANAISVNFDFLVPFFFSGPQYEGGSDWGLYSTTSPRVFFHFAQPWSYFQPIWNSMWLDAAGTIGAGWVFNTNSYLTFSQPVSYVRMVVLPSFGHVSIRCSTSDAREISSTFRAGNTEYPFQQWGELEVSGTGIQRCLIEGVQMMIKDVRIVPSPTQQPKLVLDCNGVKAPNRVDVDRGAKMTCTTSADPASAAVSDQTWTFTDSVGQHRVEGPKGDSSWFGTMVVAGTVELTAKVAGESQPLTVSMPVSIRPRDWTGKISFPEEPAPEWTKGAPLVYPPTVTGDTLADGTLGQATYPYPEPASGYAEGSGPNAGWYYLDQAPYFSGRESRIYINVALQLTDPFYRAQRGSGGHVIGVGGSLPPCGQDFMRFAARFVPAHESGHYSRAKILAESTAGASLLESASVYGRDPAEDRAAYNEMFKGYLAADSTQQAQWDRTNVLRVTCQFTVPTN